MDYREIEDIYCLPFDKKYKYFFNMVAISEQICGLKDKGIWVTIENEDGSTAMPIWPSWEFAKYCQENQWKETTIESIDLYEFLEYWLKGMKEKNCNVLLFADSSGGGISIDAEKLKCELEKHLS